MAKEIITMKTTKAGELMVTMPSGRVRFMGLWSAIRLAWDAIKSGFQVRYDD